MSVADAAHELRLAPNTVSTLVGKLTAAGLLDRGRSASDGRSVRLAVTDKARHRMASWRDLRAEIAAAPSPSCPARPAGDRRRDTGPAPVRRAPRVGVRGRVRVGRMIAVAVAARSGEVTRLRPCYRDRKRLVRKRGGAATRQDADGGTACLATSRGRGHRAARHRHILAEYKKAQICTSRDQHDTQNCFPIQRERRGKAVVLQPPPPEGVVAPTIP